jgi:hypothetical protein
MRTPVHPFEPETPQGPTGLILAGPPRDTRADRMALTAWTVGADDGIDTSFEIKEVPMDKAVTGEMLTIEEIEARYAPDWVLIGDPEIDDEQRLLDGRVLYTSTGSDELYQKATELGLTRIAVRYLGTWPEDMAFVL